VTTITRARSPTRAIAEAGVYDDPRGWLLPWSDRQPFTHNGKERRGYDVLVPDRDKRRTGKDGELVKVEWPAGLTLIPNILRHRTGNTRTLVIEGARQMLAGLSYAPDGFNVVGMNGADGIHKGIADRLGWVKGRDVFLVVDADHETNTRVKGAVQRVAWHLKEAGAEGVSLVELNGHKQADNDGLDDVLARLPEGERQPFLAQLLDQAKPVKGKAPAEAKTDDRFTDSRLAERIADEVTDGRYCWMPSLGWLAWNGKRWAECSDVTVGEAVRVWALTRFEAAVAEGRDSGHTDKEELSGWMSMLSSGRQRNVMNMARGLVERDIGELDGHLDLLNTPNGVVDLTTGKVQAHDPTLMMRKITGGEYRPGFRHPDWDRAVEAIPDDIRGWVQERMGQAITGHMTSDDRLLIVQGSGSNGKTTVMETLGRAAGDYYLLVSDRILLANPDQHPTELMDLQGVRLAVAEETPEARRLSVNRLKKTVGTPRITARKIHRDGVTFDATHSLVLSTNYRPLVEEVDHGTWRRLALAKFPYTFTTGALIGPNDREGDPTLRDRAKLDPEVWTAALTWMVEGAIRWYAHGRILPELPERVQVDTTDWRKESDQVLAYLDERVKFDPKRHVMATELLENLNDWLAERGHRPWSDKTLAARFGDHELIAHNYVVKQKVRKSNALDRPFDVDEDNHADRGKAPATYMAWVGIRFATEADRVDDYSRNRVPGHAAVRHRAMTRDVPDVPGVQKVSRDEKHTGTFQEPGTPGTMPNSVTAEGVTSTPFDLAEMGIGSYDDLEVTS
jgi:P4 family phage/plasmid primase-like protien